jgi:hypothetical protein
VRSIIFMLMTVVLLLGLSENVYGICLESDGGDDVYNQGFCDSTKNGHYEDVCNYDNGYIIENYCSSDICISVEAECPNGYVCDAGACAVIPLEDYDYRLVPREGDKIDVGCSKLVLNEVVDDFEVLISYDESEEYYSETDIFVSEARDMTFKIGDVFVDKPWGTGAQIYARSLHDRLYVGETTVVDDHEIMLLSIEYNPESGEDEYILSVDGELQSPLDECSYSWVELDREDKYDDLWIGSNLLSNVLPLPSEQYIRLDAKTYDCYREGLSCKSQFHCDNPVESFECPPSSVCCDNSCSDSDVTDEYPDGNNPELRGIVSNGRDSDCNLIDNQEDHCFNVMAEGPVYAGAHLYEGFCGESCDGDLYEHQVYTCLCVDGACLADGTELFCEDSDGGKKPFEKGTCYDVTGEHEDVCVESGEVKEYYCENNLCESEEMLCVQYNSVGPVYPCFDGACQMEEQFASSFSNTSSISVYLVIGILVAVAIGGYWYYSKPVAKKSKKRRK